MQGRTDTNIQRTHGSRTRDPSEHSPARAASVIVVHQNPTLLRHAPNAPSIRQAPGSPRGRSTPGEKAGSQRPRREATTSVAHLSWPKSSPRGPAQALPWARPPPRPIERRRRPRRSASRNSTLHDARHKTHARSNVREASRRVAERLNRRRKARDPSFLHAPPLASRPHRRSIATSPFWPILAYPPALPAPGTSPSAAVPKMTNTALNPSR